MCFRYGACGWPGGGGHADRICRYADHEFCKSEQQWIGNANTVKSWLLGGNIAGPIADLAGMNYQVDANYIHNWAHQWSQEDWNLGGSAFWASMDSRIGVNANYFTATHNGHISNGGVFGEWYFGNVTAMAKGGWLSSGGTPQGGRGNYMGAALSFFIRSPISPSPAGLEWGDIVTGRGCGAVCGPRGCEHHGLGNHGRVPLLGRIRHLRLCGLHL